MVTRSKLDRLMAQLTDLSEDELVEFQKLVTHLLGLKRSMAVLAGTLQRPGKRGRRWQKITKK